MEGTNEEKERQIGSASTAASSTDPTSPLTTDDWLHQMLERLCPDEIVIRRPRFQGNFPI